MSKTHLELKSHDGRETKYESFVHMTDTGVLEVVKTSENKTDIHRITWSQEQEIAGTISLPCTEASGLSCSRR